MKMKNLLTVCGVAAALMLSAGSIFAQNDNGGGNGGGGGGGGGRGGGGRGGGRNFDPAQFQQRMMDNYRQDLNFTNDTEWSAVQPLVQKVMDARRDVGFGGRGMFGRNRGGQGGQAGQGGQGGRGGGNNPFNQPNPERDALQQALDDNAPTAQVKDLLAKYESSQKAKQAKLKSAQDDLRKVLSPRQEAAATLTGLLD